MVELKSDTKIKKKKKKLNLEKKKKKLNDRQKYYCTCDCSFRKSGSWNSPLKTWRNKGPGLGLNEIKAAFYTQILN